MLALTIAPTIRVFSRIDGLPTIVFGLLAVSLVHQDLSMALVMDEYLRYPSQRPRKTVAAK
jgi:hypothetical protein